MFRSADEHDTAARAATTPGPSAVRAPRPGHGAGL